MPRPNRGVLHAGSIRRPCFAFGQSWGRSRAPSTWRTPSNGGSASPRLEPSLSMPEVRSWAGRAPAREDRIQDRNRFPGRPASFLLIKGPLSDDCSVLQRGVRLPVQAPVCDPGRGKPRDGPNARPPVSHRVARLNPAFHPPLAPPTSGLARWRSPARSCAASTPSAPPGSSPSPQIHAARGRHTSSRSKATTVPPGDPHYVPSSTFKRPAASASAVWSSHPRIPDHHP